jgi:hypothetical protein
MEGVVMFLIGSFLSAVLIIFMMGKLQPEIKLEELYRFCLVKNISLEECKIPERPYILPTTKTQSPLLHHN